MNILLRVSMLLVAALVAQVAIAAPPKVLVTPSSRFAALPDYPFKTHEASVPWGDTTVTMRYVDEGPRNAPPVLLLHGQPTWSYAYRKVIPLLVARGHRVIAPDLIGFGRSDKPSRLQDYSYARHKASMAAFVRSVELQKATLVVHDWGGLIGLPVLAEMPDRFANVVVLNTSLPDGSDAETPRFKAGFDAWINLLRTAPLVEVDKVVATLTARQLSAPELAAYMAPFPDGSWQAGVRSITSLIPRSPYAAGASDNVRVRAFLQQWNKPVMIAFSADSERVHPRQFELFRTLFRAESQWLATRIPQTSHLLFEDRPDRIAALIDAFMRGSTPPSDPLASSQPQTVVPTALAGAALQDKVDHFVSFGGHRTGSAGAAATLGWAEGQLQAVGYRTSHMPIRFPVARIDRAVVTVGRQRLTALPAWFPNWTAAKGISGRLQPLDKAGADDIAYVLLPYAKGSSLYDPAYRDIVEQIAVSKAKGIVAVVEHPSGEQVGLNVLPSRNAASWPPMLTLGAKNKADLDAAIGRQVTLHLLGETVEQDHPNLIAEAGPDGGPVLVITTPLNGWFSVGGERGAGVAIALGLAGHVHRVHPGWKVRVAMTAGHELGAKGMHSILADPRFAPDKVRLWLNLGANIASPAMQVSRGEVLRLAMPAGERGLVTPPDLMAPAAQFFDGQPGYDQPLSSEGARVPGEAALILRAGHHRVIGLVGYQPLHHTPLDDARSTRPDTLEPVANALARLVAEGMK